MIVWNTFQNDARVLKEAETLAGQGHRVTVFALLQPDETPEHEILAPGLEVVRISRTPLRALRSLFQPDGSRPPRTVEAGVGGAFVDTPLKSSRLRRAGEILSRSAIHVGLYRAMVASRPDVVHAHDVNTLPTAWAAARRAGARLVYDAHEISTDREGYRELRGLIAWAEKRLMPRADATITTTEMRAKFFARAYGVPRPLVLQNRPRFADLARGTLIRDRLGLGDELPIVLYQGGLQPGRGLEDLGRGDAGAAALPPRLHRRRPAPRRAQDHGRPTGGWRAGPLRSHRAARRASRLDRLGRHRRAADPQHLPQPPQHRIRTSSSNTPWPGCRWWRATSPRSAGWSAPTTSACSSTPRPRALAAALGRLVADGELRARLAANARASARALSWEAQEAELVRLYERVLARS